jgi:hypothetical protein
MDQGRTFLAFPHMLKGIPGFVKKLVVMKFGKVQSKKFTRYVEHTILYIICFLFVTGHYISVQSCRHRSAQQGGV